MQTLNIKVNDNSLHQMFKSAHFYAAPAQRYDFKTS